MTYEATPVDAAIIAHRLSHALVALSKIDTSLIAALAATANILRGAGASKDEINDATVAFGPLVKLVSDSKKLVAGIADCNCQQEENARSLAGVIERAAKIEKDYLDATGLAGRIDRKPLRKFVLIKSTTIRGNGK